MRTSLVIFAALLVSANAWAATLLSSGGVSNGPSAQISTFPGSPSAQTHSAAAGFTVPAGLSYSLDDIVVRLASDGNPTLTLSALLYLDSGGNPGGSPVADLSTSAPLPNSSGLFITLTPSVPFTLNPSTTYWLVLNVVVPGEPHNVVWTGTNSANSYSGALTYAGSRFINTTGLPNTVVAGDLLFTVNGTALADTGTPEPATITVSALTLVGLFWRRKWLAGR